MEVVEKPARSGVYPPRDCRPSAARYPSGELRPPAARSTFRMTGPPGGVGRFRMTERQECPSRIQAASGRESAGVEAIPDDVWVNTAGWNKQVLPAPCRQYLLVPT